MNEDGYVFIRNIGNEKEFKKVKISKDNNYNFLKFNPVNKNQFFISSENEFKVYDIREGKEVDSINKFKNCIDISLDGFKYLVTFRDSVKLYEKNIFSEITILEYQDLTFSNICYYNDRLDCLIAGNESGDFLFSPVKSFD